MAAVRIHLRFSGRVQGVGFRQFVRSRSGPLRLGGYVMNRPDGTVEAELEGEPEAIAELVRGLQEEHLRAHIVRVERHEVPVQGSRAPVEVR